MSPETPDGVLLRLYVKRSSEAAFELLVRRHLNLVYFTCLREAEDVGLAEDAALSVFLILAHRAPSLRGGTGLAGWLFQTARLAARSARRDERRRRGREQEVAEMIRHEQEASAAGVWEAVTPHLNDALALLGTADREAVLLRFFEGCGLAEIGARLGVSENTARMRVVRAVEKMRRRLSAEGVTLAASVLAALLLEHSALPAPASCTVAAALLPLPGAVALQSGSASVQAAQIAQGVSEIMAIKTITTAAVTLALCIAAGGLALKNRHQQQAAPQQAKAQMAYTQLLMAHGRDIRRPMRGLDEMYSYLVKRETQELTEGEKLHRPRAKTRARYDAAYKAGTAEIKRVVDSGYAKSFDKSVVEQAIRDASH